MLIGKIKSKHIAITAVIFLPISALLLWWWLFTFSDQWTEKKVVNELGYQALIPPTSIYRPGTINTVEIRSDGSVRLHLTCKLDEKYEHVEYDTIDRNYKERWENGFNITASLREKIKSTSVANYVKSAMLSLRNMRVLVMSGETLLKIQKEVIYREAPFCKDAIIHNLKSGALVCQTEEVLQADAVYRLDYHKVLSLDQQATIADTFNGTVRLPIDNSGTEEIHGNGLYYGVKNKRYCFILDKNDELQQAPLEVALKYQKHIESRNKVAMDTMSFIKNVSL